MSQLPIQVYCCPRHGEFPVEIPFKDGVPRTLACPKVVGRGTCLRASEHVLKAPAAVIVKDGTGARKGD